jgi:pyruvate,water dikinase
MVHLDGHRHPGPAFWQLEADVRRHNFDRFNERAVTPPKFLKGNRPYLPDAPGGVSRGLPTSAGKISGVARVVKELNQIGRLGAGEILVINSTAPGWSPVFAVISGIVVETGGVLSHSSCLAREYGFPAVQIEDAMRLIAATITVDGNTGQ